MAAAAALSVLIQKSVNLRMPYFIHISDLSNITRTLLVGGAHIYNKPVANDVCRFTCNYI